MKSYKEIDRETALYSWWSREDKNQILLKNKLTGDIFCLKIEYDEDTWNPRTDCDNLCTITSCRNNNWDIGDEHISRDEMSEWRDKMNEKAIRGEIWQAPVYMYDHSGQTISLSDFGDKWDSGVCAIIWVTKEKVLKEYPGATEENWKEFAKSAAENEIKLYNQYISGDVYGYTLYKAEETEHKHISDGKTWTTTEWEWYEGVGGFYGDPVNDGLVDDAIAMVAGNNEIKDVVFVEEEEN